MAESPGKIHALAPEKPSAGLPASLPVALDASERQGVPDDVGESLVEDARQASSFTRVVETGLVGVDVGRQAPFPPKVVPGVFVTRYRAGLIDSKVLAEPGYEASSVPRGGRAAFDVREESRVLPNRKAVLPKVGGKRPARKRLTRIPLALSFVDEAVRRESLVEPPKQGRGIPALGGA